MTAKSFCWKVKVPYRCGCYITGNAIHNCDKIVSKCSLWLIMKRSNRECEDCMLDGQGGRNLTGRVGSSNDPGATVNVNGSVVDSATVVESGNVGENGSIVGSVDQVWEWIEPVCYTESARKVNIM